MLKEVGRRRYEAAWVWQSGNALQTFSACSHYCVLGIALDIPAWWSPGPVPWTPSWWAWTLLSRQNLTRQLLLHAFQSFSSFLFQYIFHLIQVSWIFQYISRCIHVLITSLLEMYWDSVICYLNHPNTCV